MTPADHVFCLVLALVIAGVGLSAPFAFPVTTTPGTAPPLVGREDVSDDHPSYTTIAGQTAESLVARDREARRAELVARLAPQVPLSSWRGVLLVDGAAEERDATTLIADERATPGREEGPPFHLVIGRDGEVHATRRWLRQRPWPVSGLPDPENWIIVVDLGGGEVSELLVEGLRRPGVSRGAAARRDTDGNVTVESEGRDG